VRHMAIPKVRTPQPLRYLALVALALTVPVACAGGGQRAPDEPILVAEVPGDSPLGSYLAGRHAERVHDVGAAARYLTDALAADPENERLRRRAFLLLLSDGQNAEALDLARTIVQHDDKEPVANLVLAVDSAKAGDYLAAAERLAELPRRGGNEILVPLMLGWLWYGEGRMDEAEKALDQLGEVKGFESFYQLHRAEFLDLVGRREEAAKVHEALREGGLRSLRLLIAVASFYQRTGRADEAEKLYLGYLKEDPDSLIASTDLEKIRSGETLPRLIGSAVDGMAEALFNVASALYQENVAQTALVYGRLALFLKPDFPEAQLLVGNVLELNGQRAEAVEIYEAVPRSSPLSWNARLAVARNYDQLERADDAAKLLEAMADERSERADALIALGDLHRKHEQFEAAVKAYDRAMERIGDIQKRHWGLFYARGIVLERSKQWQRAEADFLRALELEPNQPYVLNYLGYSWVELGINLERARQMLETAVSLRRDDGYITDSLGWVLYRTGAFEDAVKHLERAVELRPHDSTINDHLGDAYWKVGRLNEARFQWRRALSLDPDPEQVPVIEGKLDRGLEGNETVGQSR